VVRKDPHRSASEHGLCVKDFVFVDDELYYSPSLDKILRYYAEAPDTVICDFTGTSLVMQKLYEYEGQLYYLQYALYEHHFDPLAPYNEVQHQIENSGYERFVFVRCDLRCQVATELRHFASRSQVVGIQFANGNLLFSTDRFESPDVDKTVRVARALNLLTCELFGEQRGTWLCE